jgi:hypothetical protein
MLAALVERLVLQGGAVTILSALLLKRAHLVQGILDRVVLLAGHIWGLSSLASYSLAACKFQIKIDARSKLVNVYSILGALIDIGCGRHKAIVAGSGAQRAAGRRAQLAELCISLSPAGAVQFGADTLGLDIAARLSSALKFVNVDGLGPALERLVGRRCLLHLRVALAHELGSASDIRFSLFTIENGGVILEYLDLLLLSSFGPHLLVRLAPSLDHLHMKLVVGTDHGKRL